MRKKIPFLLSALFLLALNLPVAANPRFVPAALLASPRAVVVGDAETDRSRDGLQGPVRRVRTETSKLMSKGGKLTEGTRTVLETATYDMKGVKIDTAYFLGAGGSLTGKEVYSYDDKGNIVEMTLSKEDGSVLSKEKYEYDFDAMGNWTKMTTSVAVIENGQMSFEPTEVTYRVIAYYLEDATAKKLQTAAAAPLPANASAPAPANVIPASMVNNKPATSAVNAPAPSSSSTQSKMTPAPVAAAAASPNATTPKPNAAANTAAPTSQRLNNAPALPTASGASAAASSANLTLGLPNLVASANNSGGALVKSIDDLPPPPPVKPVVKAPVRPISGGVLNGTALDMPKPVYPDTARRAQIKGVVTVEVVIDVSGKVIGARAVSGPEMLRDAAVRAARQAKFTPALLSGQPVRVSGVIHYNFSF